MKTQCDLVIPEENIETTPDFDFGFIKKCRKSYFNI